MFSALLRKEWAQLGVLRWVGLCLGLMMPLFLIALAEAASRGLTPYGRLSGYSTADLFMDALPIMLTGLWALLALLVCSQAFAGDRASGTERFLLERPVRRSTIWRARLFAAIASILIMVVCHLLFWMALVALTVDYSDDQWRKSLVVMSGFGALVLLVSFTGAVAAACFVSSPIQAVLLGVVFAIIPAGLCSLLGGFPMAAIGHLPIGFVIPWLLPIGYLLASFVVSCRGEPAGRGRIKRGAWVLGLSLLAIPLLFLLLAPLAVRLNSGFGGSGAIPIASREGSSACLLDYEWRASSGWIVDLERKKRVRFLPPPVWDAAWSEDGSRLAVLHSAGALGRLRAGMVIDFFDGAGRKIADRINVGEEGEWLDDLRWDDDRLLVRSGGGTEWSAVLIISPEIGSVVRVGLPEDWWKWWLIGPTGDGEFFLYRLIDEELMRYGLYPLDLERAEVRTEPSIVEEGYPTYSGKWISPSGRFWLRHLGDAEAGMQITELHSGERYRLPECRRALWIGKDGFVCLEEREQGEVLTIGAPGEERGELRAWPEGRLALEVSPDGRRLLIQHWMPEAEGDEKEGGFWAQGAWWKTGGRLLEIFVYDAESGELRELAGLVEELNDDRPAAIRWAGSGSIALTGPGRLALADLEGDGGWSYIVGSR